MQASGSIETVPDPKQRGQEASPQMLHLSPFASSQWQRDHRASPKMLLAPHSFPYGSWRAKRATEFGRKHGCFYKESLETPHVEATFGVVVWLQFCKTVRGGWTAKILPLCMEYLLVFIPWVCYAPLRNLSEVQAVPPELQCMWFCLIFFKLKSALRSQMEYIFTSCRVGPYTEK